MVLVLQHGGVSGGDDATRGESQQGGFRKILLQEKDESSADGDDDDDDDGGDGGLMLVATRRSVWWSRFWKRSVGAVGRMLPIAAIAIPTIARVAPPEIPEWDLDSTTFATPNFFHLLFNLFNFNLFLLRRHEEDA